MNHICKGGDVWYCVAGGVAVGAAVALGYTAFFDAKPVTVGNHNGSSVWNKAFKESGTAGFTVRGPPELSTLKDEKAKADGVDVFLEIWEAGTSEPPHSHPGDDATVVVEGKMVIQFYSKQGEKDGAPVTLVAGQTGYIESNRMHSVKYVDKCKLVYVHDTAFGFKDCTAEVKA